MMLRAAYPFTDGPLGRASIRTAVVLAGLSPAAVVASPADQCLQRIYSNDFEIEVQSVQDLGQGMVMETSTGQGPISGSQRVSFQHCESGGRIGTVASSWDESGSTTSPVNPYEVIAAALADDAAQDLADLADELTKQGVPADVATLSIETCGCAAFYPELRDGKTPWSAQ